MFTLDPAKILIIGIVAMVVLGPDKLPAAARKMSSLLADLRRLRASLHQQVQETVGDHPFVTELTSTREGLVRLRKTADPRQALYRSIGLNLDDLGVAPDGTVDGVVSGPGLVNDVPGSIDLAAGFEPAGRQTDDVHSSPSRN